MTAFKGVLQQLQESDRVAMTSADDLESLRKSMNLLKFNPEQFTEPTSKLRPQVKKKIERCEKLERVVMKENFVVNIIFDACC